MEPTIADATPIQRLLVHIILEGSSAGRLNVQTCSNDDVIQDVLNGSTMAHVQVRTRMETRHDGRAAAPKKSFRTRFAASPSPVLRELGSEALLQSIRGARALARYIAMDPNVRAEYADVVIQRGTPISVICASKYIPALVSATRADKDGLDVQTPSAFEVRLYLHMLHILCAPRDSRRGSCPRVKVDIGDRQRMATRLGYGLQCVVYAWDCFAEKCKLRNAEALIAPFLSRKPGSDRYTGEVNKSTQSIEDKTAQDKLMQELQDRPSASSPSVIHRVLPTVCSKFMEHLGEVCLSNALYGNVADVGSSVKDFLFTVTDDPPMIAALPEAMRTVLGYEQEHPAPEAHRAVAEATPRGKKRSHGEVAYDNPPLTTAPDPLDNISDAEVRDAIDLLRDEFKSYADIYTCSFQQLEEEYEGRNSLALTNSVHFICTDAPYGTRNSMDRPNSEHDVIELGDMRNCVSVINNALVDGGHGVIFCAVHQFQHWVDILNDVRDPSKPKDKDKVFTVEPTPLYFVRAPGSYGTCTRFSYYHTNIVEIAVHFWKHNCVANRQTRVRYSDQGLIASRYPPWTNTKENVPTVVVPEAVRVQQVDDTGRVRKSTMLRPEQKSIAVLGTLIGEYTKPGDTVLDMFAGTFSTAKACFVTGSPRKFIGCEIDKDCVKQGNLAMLQSFAEALTRENNPVDTTGRVRRAAGIVLGALARKRTAPSRVRKAWTTPEGAEIFQRFPPYMYQAIGVLAQMPRFATAHADVPLHRLPTSIRARIDNLSPETLLQMEMVQAGLVLGRSLIRHPDAGTGLFAAKSFPKGATICFYYGTLVYSDLGKHHTSQMMYGTGIMAVNATDFIRYSMSIGNVLLRKHGQRECFIVAAPFCAARHINDPVYLQGDPEIDIAPENARLANVKFAKLDARVRNYPVQHYVVTVKAVRDIVAGDELYVDYGTRYWNNVKTFQETSEATVQSRDNGGAGSSSVQGRGESGAGSSASQGDVASAVKGRGGKQTATSSNSGGKTRCIG